MHPILGVSVGLVAGTEKPPTTGPLGVPKTFLGCSSRMLPTFLKLRAAPAHAPPRVLRPGFSACSNADFAAPATGWSHFWPHGEKGDSLLALPGLYKEDQTDPPVKLRSAQLRAVALALLPAPACRTTGGPHTRCAIVCGDGPPGPSPSRARLRLASVLPGGIYGDKMIKTGHTRWLNTC
jgi:hypothetical protein